MFKLTKIQYIKISMIYTLLALAAVCCYNFKNWFGSPRKRPFQCFDDSLSKPFILEDTVPPKQLYILGVYFPIALIAGCELLASWLARNSLNSCRWMLTYVLKSNVVLTLFLVGLSIERLLKNAAKLKMSRLRPNFITVCDPVNLDGYRCHELEDTTYMEQYQCSSDAYPSWALTSAYLSFPSGHTSLTSYSMVFVVCYLYLLSLKLKQLKISSTFVLIIMQTVCLLMIVFVGMSRVFDYRHHWTDILAGFVFGCSIALAISWYLKEKLINVEKWLKEIASDSAVVENSKVFYLNTEEKEDSCAIELGNA